MHSCLLCIKVDPDNCYSDKNRPATESEVTHLCTTLKEAGFDLAEIDAKADELKVVWQGGTRFYGPIGLSKGQVEGCLTGDDLLRVLTELVRSWGSK